MEPIIDNEDDKTQEAVEQTKHEYNSVAAQYSKMNRHASAEHVELLLAAMPRGVAEQRRRIDAEARIPELQKLDELQKRVEFLEDAGVQDEDDEDLVEARTALATARRDARRRVVDLGCGAGRDYPAFEERGVEYLGVDASEGMLTVARERFPDASFEAQDLCRLDLPARSFDGAFANASLQHVPACVEIKVAVSARWRGG
jgi:SAM-dependent methyltransferase